MCVCVWGWSMWQATENRHYSRTSLLWSSPFAFSTALSLQHDLTNDCYICGSVQLCPWAKTKDCDWCLRVFFSFEDGWYSTRAGLRDQSPVDGVWGHRHCLGKIIGSGLLAQNILIDLGGQESPLKWENDNKFTTLWIMWRGILVVTRYI